MRPVTDGHHGRNANHRLASHGWRATRMSKKGTSDPKKKRLPINSSVTDNVIHGKLKMNRRNPEGQILLGEMNPAVKTCASSLKRESSALRHRRPWGLKAISRAIAVR